MKDVVAQLKQDLGDAVSQDPELLDRHRADSWMLAELAAYEERPRPRPLAVVRAQTTADVAACLATCHRLRVPVIPYGGGSGVCGGVEASGGEIVLVTRDLEGLVELDDRDLTATFRAGTLGIEAENRVREAGLTIGHWPQSVELSTVGGWVATRAAGQYSTGYGNIEDLLLSLEGVLPDGSIVRTRATPRASMGPDLRQLFLGSEGILGVVTEVTFSLRPLPEAEERAAFHFPSFHAGLETIRKIMRNGWRPPVVRLYDADESARHFGQHSPAGQAMLVLIHEGNAELVALEARAVAQGCLATGGQPADRSVVDHWVEERNQVPSFRAFLERGLIVDTIEVAATWSRVAEVYDRVTEALRDLPEVLVATAHSSHSYRSGTNLYFSFAARPEDPDRFEDVYRECWRRTMTQTDACGGGIGHHHGVGRVRRDYLESEIGPSGVRLLRDIKRAIDPHAILNPGNLLPGE